MQTEKFTDIFKQFYILQSVNIQPGNFLFIIFKTEIFDGADFLFFKKVSL